MTSLYGKMPPEFGTGPFGKPSTARLTREALEQACKAPRPKPLPHVVVVPAPIAEIKRPGRGA